jgi:hypothetical protein
MVDCGVLRLHHRKSWHDYDKPLLNQQQLLLLHRNRLQV